jgi:hypothetical protein
VDHSRKMVVSRIWEVGGWERCKCEEPVEDGQDDSGVESSVSGGVGSPDEGIEAIALRLSSISSGLKGLMWISW